MPLIYIPVLLSAAAWLYLLTAHGRFWLSGPVLDPAETGDPGLASETWDSAELLHLAVVIPARDEAEHILATLRSLLAQQLPARLSIVLVDDNSTDATGQLARAIAGPDPRLTVLTGQPLPAGWTGKLWAVAQGLTQPHVQAADYVLLTDADITHAPGHLRALLAHAERHRLGLTSEMVRLRTETFAERATIPAFVFFFAMLYPFRQVADPRRATAAAAGGTMLVSRAALTAAAGVSRIRAELIDDVALAREIKSAGFPIWLGHGLHVRSERRYPRLADVWQMVARTAYVQLRFSPWLLAGTCFGMLLLYGEPVAATLFAHGPPRLIGLACWIAMAAAFQPILRRYQRNPAWGAALPLIALFYLAATLASAARFHRGQGGTRKSRHYPAQP